MAHNINYNSKTGKHSFFSVKEKAWHGLGQIISSYPTSEEAIIQAGLNYEVEKRPLFTYDTENNKLKSSRQNSGNNPNSNSGNKNAGLIAPEIEVPDYYATVRNDTEQVLGVVGNDYEVVQNVNAFSFFDAIVASRKDILYETAGALGKGERIFITAKLPDYIKVGRDDLIEQYLLLTTSHDGLGSISIAFTPVRIVCQNTLNAAMKNSSNTVKIRHTASAAEKLKSARQILGSSMLQAVELEAVFNRWARVKITDREVKRLIQLAMAPNREAPVNPQNEKQEEFSTVFNNTVSSVMEYALTSPSQQEVTTKGTLFGAYNAVTGYFQNVRDYKDEEARFKSILYGAGLQKSQAAFDLCAGFAKHGSSALLLN
jgi:phage/plasmid-like protein (TIGR03299 family)